MSDIRTGTFRRIIVTSEHAFLAMFKTFANKTLFKTFISETSIQSLHGGGGKAFYFAKLDGREYPVSQKSFRLLAKHPVGWVWYDRHGGKIWFIYDLNHEDASDEDC